MSYKVGLTGGIGSGKSTVAALFAALDVPVIDTDVISHQLTHADGVAIPAIRAEFGADYLNTTGALDRTKMRNLVFSDPAAKLRLEAILHPIIRAQAREMADSSHAPYVLLVIPLLFDTNHYLAWINRTLTVDCSEDAQIARATLRSGISEQTVRSILAQQLTRSQRLAKADDAILNVGTLQELQPQITRLHQRYLALAQTSN